MCFGLLPSVIIFFVEKNIFFSKWFGGIMFGTYLLFDKIMEGFHEQENSKEINSTFHIINLIIILDILITTTSFFISNIIVSKAHS